MTVDAWVFLGTFITAASGIILAVITNRTAARRDVVNDLGGMVDRLTKRLDAVEAENVTLRSLVKELETENAQLRAEVERMSDELDRRRKASSKGWG